MRRVLYQQNTTQTCFDPLSTDDTTKQNNPLIHNMEVNMNPPDLDVEYTLILSLLQKGFLLKCVR